MKTVFSIGEISKLFNIPSKTLRYYDEIGLFKPEYVNEKNKYRYYTTEQFEQLNTINFLKILGMPLKLIKSHIENRDIEYILDLLEKQNEIVENKILKLQDIKSRLSTRISQIKNVKNFKKLEIITEEIFEERSVLSLEEKINNNSELELSLRRLQNQSKSFSAVFVGQVGVSLKKQKILNEDFGEYDSVFIVMEKDRSEEGELLKYFPKAKYICISFSGSHTKSKIYYDKLLTYIKEKKYKIVGDSYEITLIDFSLSKNEEEYLTEIQIPVK